MMRQSVFFANLGFVPGAEVIVLSAIGGNVIVNIKDSRVAVKCRYGAPYYDLIETLKK